MMMRWKSGLGLAVVVLGLGCRNGEDDPAAALLGANETGRIQVQLTGSTAGYPADRLVIDSATAKSDTLYVYVSHGGGCRKHEYAAVAFNGWLESYPVQVGVFVAHDAKGDQCRAQLRPVLRFDLTPLREAYGRSYGAGPAEVVLRVSELFPWNHGPVLVRYRWG
jgi:hypothetical protein